MEITEKLWKSREIILEILTDRGYDVKPEDHMRLDQFEEWVGDMSEDETKDEMTLRYDEAKQGKIIVFWIRGRKLAKNIVEFYQKMEEEGVSRSIMIVKQGVTPNAKEIIRTLRMKKVYIDVYTVEETLINITKHRLTPKHVICTPSEKKKVMKGFAVDKTQLPGIRTTDPFVRHLGATKGQLIKIERESETQHGHTTLYYRIVK